jgi:hypothetical protein
MMNLTRKREAADLAAAILVGQRKQLSSRYAGLMHTFDRYRPAILVGGGFLGGYILGNRKTARLATGVLSLTSLGMSLMRSPLGALALTAVLGNRAGSIRKGPTESKSDAESGQR